MKICIIRHGETDWNAIGKLQGRENIPLNENGKAQARQCGMAINKLTQIELNWSVIITSPLLRAKQTADIIAEQFNIKTISNDDDLVERDYGKASGTLPNERRLLYPDGNFDEAEPWETLQERVYGAVIKNAKNYSTQNIIMVSHGSAINSVLSKVTNGAIGSGKTRLKNACLNLFEFENDILSLLLYNKTWGDL